MAEPLLKIEGLEAGYGDIQKRVRYERIITPADWDTRYEIHRGATFNLTHSMDQLLMFRPRNRFEDLDGVYLTGGGTHPGSGLPTIFESAKIASKLAAADLGLDACRVVSTRPRPASARPSAPVSLKPAEMMIAARTPTAAHSSMSAGTPGAGVTMTASSTGSGSSAMLG